MQKLFSKYIFTTGFLLWNVLTVQAQVKPVDSASFYNEIKTYTNPVLPGDHPDPTLLRVGDDFFHCGSSFHFTPYLPIYHSKDLVHWELISRVLPPEKAGWVTDRPSAGIWQGAITYFYGSYWIYFSANGQWFCKADSPWGPWSAAERVNTNPVTGPLGYDNSIFVDEDGKPYMVIKNGQKVNRLQALGKDGQLTDTVINMDWINARLQYSWAEGPVMCKRNGYYYYFPAGDVSGGQYVLRGKELSADSTKWERLGDFFKPITDPGVGFRRPNHIAAPLMLPDGTWWTIGQSYEKYDKDDWSGMGRQTSLYQVRWEDNRPWGMAPTTRPLVKPDLPRAGILWRSVQPDYFNKDSLELCWHFLSKKDAGHYSLLARKGWLRLSPDSGRTSIMQKETDHYYSVVTRIDFNAAVPSAKAGILLSNGNQRVSAGLYTGYDGSKKIIFRLDTAERTALNTFGNTVWLKLERRSHWLYAWFGDDGKKWISLGAPVSAVNIDKAQPNFNSWVGTSVGLFAEGRPADFDHFICKDGFSSLPATGFSNYYGVEKEGKEGAEAVTNSSVLGGWFMISGVELGGGKQAAKAVTIEASALAGGFIEVYLDDLEKANKIASFSLSPAGKDKWKLFKRNIKNIQGHHDVFIKYLPGTPRNLFIKSIRFTAE